MAVRDAHFSHVPHVNETNISRCNVICKSSQRKLLQPKYRVSLSQRILSRDRLALFAEVYSLDRELYILSVMPIKHAEGFAELLWRNAANCV